MLSLTEIFAILIIHWFADFVLQTDKQAKGKSKNWNDLIDHTESYSLTWFFCGVPLVFFMGVNPLSLFSFCLITFVAHTITDYFTSRLNSSLLPKKTEHWIDRGYFKDEGGNIHNFFVSIGFDQILHYAQLFLTYWWLKN